MAKTKRTVVTEVKPKQEMIEIPVTLLRHLVRVSHNRQAKMFLMKATGQTRKTNQPGMNVIEPEVAKVEKKERAKAKQKESTKPTPLKKVEKLAAKVIDKNFNKK